jgi:hypothetical protein
MLIEPGGEFATSLLKRAAPRGRGSTAKKGRKTDIASIQNMMIQLPNKAPPRVSESLFFFLEYAGELCVFLLIGEKFKTDP